MFNASIKVNVHVSDSSVCDVNTTSPPNALIDSLSRGSAFVNPSSEMYPKFLNLASNAPTASVGNVVPKGATLIAPATFGLPYVTFCVFAIYKSLLFNNDKYQTPLDTCVVFVLNL